MIKGFLTVAGFWVLLFVLLTHPIWILTALCIVLVVFVSSILFMSAADL